ncbi:MAG: flagellar basal body L-ring protein FlgH [Armatimonadetes bacterium]|jgi:flagellar L-ring protein precursor FlgH|nr:flagellar basal body L-ring protein FlgH [Armatimonadota bacterium]
MSRFTALSCILLLVITTPLAAESLWSEAKTPTGSMYSDKKAMQAGDIVTIIIEESAVSKQQASTDAKKDSSLKAGPGVGPLLKNIPLFDYSGGDSVKASGSSTRSSAFVTRMSAVVTKVMDNGNLEIEGTRFVETNKEKAQVKLTGIIRRQDISPDNTISSAYIANAQITHTGSGPVGSRQKEGIVSRIFKVLF